MPMVVPSNGVSVTPATKTDIGGVAFEPLPRRHGGRCKRGFDVDVEILDLHADGDADHVIELDADDGCHIDRGRLARRDG